MKIVYAPQQNDSLTVSYSFDGESVTATVNGQSETWDFSDMPEGRAQPGPNGEPSISADVLPVCPVVDAERVNGELTVTMLDWYHDHTNPPQQREEVV